MLTAVLEVADGVESFVILARREGDLSDTVEILYSGTASADVLREALRARARISPDVRATSLEQIEALQLPPNARKRRTFVDLR